MKVTHRSDHEINDASCKEVTGKTIAEWFAFLDSIDGLKKGRRDSVREITDLCKDRWWPTTLYVEYEAYKGVKKKDGVAEGYSICVTKNIAAPEATTYKVWTDPKTFAEMFGDNAKQDAQEGGKLTCDGGCEATFTRVRPDKDLRFTWTHPGATWPMTVDVMFQDNGGKTLMNVMTSRIQTRGEADGLRDAWTDALNRLKGIAEAAN